MAGIYFHIPFCKQACHYCNFHFSTNTSLKNEMIGAMLKEMELLHTSALNNTGGKEIIHTIYFGGGTPSIMETSDVNQLLAQVRKFYYVAEDAEITLEANPDDISENKLKAWKESGINRLSLGIQSINDQELLWMNRVHNSSSAIRSVEMIKQAGFTNFSIDLIYGTPVNNATDWKADMKNIIALNAPHVACYALTVEGGTALFKMIEQKKKAPVNNDIQSEQYLYLMEMMEEAGYEHYEISNFAKPGYRSRHNSSYWKSERYIGIGPSAHSFDGTKRKWNISNNPLYISNINNGRLPFEEEILSEKEKYNEFVMISLRTVEGLDLNMVETRFGKEKRNELESSAKKYLADFRAIIKDSKIILTKEGKLFADGIASELFW